MPSETSDALPGSPRNTSARPASTAALIGTSASSASSRRASIACTLHHWLDGTSCNRPCDRDVRHARRVRISQRTRNAASVDTVATPFHRRADRPVGCCFHLPFLIFATGPSSFFESPVRIHAQISPPFLPIDYFNLLSSFLRICNTPVIPRRLGAPSLASVGGTALLSYGQFCSRRRHVGPATKEMEKEEYP